jgi:tetratricopeptide (TPR) repeat protein
VSTRTICIALCLLGCGVTHAETPTFTRDIAPIVFEHCAPCHRPGESAPFGLIDYTDVKKHDEQIVIVTASGFMPPWLPERGPHEFVGRRSLTREQIDMFKRWYEGGSPRGDPQQLPPRPRWTEGWQLGPPDLVIEAAETFTVPADGIDVFRNIVVPVDIEQPRWVSAVELRPGNKRIVHHGIMRIDRTPSSRRLDEQDPLPGFGGMVMGHAIPPGGQFIGWTPGKMPSPGIPGMAWRLDAGTDVVLQLHMLPTGKPESIRPRIGFHFTDSPPTLHPTEITLYVAEIDIAPGVRDYTIEDRFVLPVPVEVLGIYPHAHYLGRSITSVAKLPDGSTTDLIRIEDWDFNWQDDYRYVKPVRLPAGTTVSARFVYDNSADNVRNPNVPPRRVVRAEKSTDEMASLGLQVLTGNDKDRARLDEAIARTWLAKFPDSWSHVNNLGIALAAQGKLEQAVGQYRRALELEPRVAETRYNLGLALVYLGRPDDAVTEFERALQIDPGNADALNNLGHLALARGQLDAAIGYFRRAVELRPTMDQAHYNLAIALGARGALVEAAGHYRKVLELDPSFAMAHNNLGTVLHRQGDLDAAMSEYREALRLDPSIGMSHRNLGLALIVLGRYAEAMPHLERALEIDPDDAAARQALETARTATGSR